MCVHVRVMPRRVATCRLFWSGIKTKTEPTCHSRVTFWTFDNLRSGTKRISSSKPWEPNEIKHSTEKVSSFLIARSSNAKWSVQDRFTGHCWYVNQPSGITVTVRRTNQLLLRVINWMLRSWKSLVCWHWRSQCEKIRGNEQTRCGMCSHNLAVDLCTILMVVVASVSTCLYLQGLLPLNFDQVSNLTHFSSVNWDKYENEMFFVRRSENSPFLYSCYVYYTTCYLYCATYCLYCATCCLYGATFADMTSFVHWTWLSWPKLYWQHFQNRLTVSPPVWM